MRELVRQSDEVQMKCGQDEHKCKQDKLLHQLCKLITRQTKVQGTLARLASYLYPTLL